MLYDFQQSFSNRFGTVRGINTYEWCNKEFISIFYNA